jgi:hypothetical protein
LPKRTWPRYATTRTGRAAYPSSGYLYLRAEGCGMLVGPSVGGALAEPASRLGAPFAEVSLWEMWPYLLPCLPGVALTVLVLGVKELLALSCCPDGEDSGCGRLNTRHLHAPPPRKSPGMCIWHEIVWYLAARETETGRRG